MKQASSLNQICRQSRNVKTLNLLHQRTIFQLRFRTKTGPKNIFQSDAVVVDYELFVIRLFSIVVSQLQLLFCCINGFVFVDKFQYVATVNLSCNSYYNQSAGICSKVCFTFTHHATSFWNGPARRRRKPMYRIAWSNIGKTRFNVLLK